jgi:hypothetical protein
MRDVLCSGDPGERPQLPSLGRQDARQSLRRIAHRLRPRGPHAAAISARRRCWPRAPAPQAAKLGDVLRSVH